MEEKRSMVDITEIINSYLPISRKKAMKFVRQYLEPKRIGNRFYVDRVKLEEILYGSKCEDYPLSHS